MLNVSHKNLEVYTIALQLTQEIYRMTNKFPGDENYNLARQFSTASLSACSNMAGRAARISAKEKKTVSRNCESFESRNGYPS